MTRAFDVELVAMFHPPRGPSDADVSTVVSRAVERVLRLLKRGELTPEPGGHSADEFSRENCAARTS